MERPVREIHYGKEVWVSPKIEGIRRDECLCLHCGHLKPNQADNCPIAVRLYGICVEFGVATPVTRCPNWKPGGKHG